MMPARRHAMAVALVAFGLSALGPVACAPAVDPDVLFNRLGSPDLEVRQEAMDKVEEIIQKNQYDVFVRGLKSANLLYRAQAMVFLGRMKAPQAHAAVRDLLALDRRMMLPYNPIRFKPQPEETDSRILAATLIQRAGGDPEAIKVLLAGVDQEQGVEVLVGTCFAVGALRDPAGLPFLDTVAKRPEVLLVRAALEAAGQFSQPEAFAILARLATHESPEVRADVLSTLSSRRDAAVLQILEQVGQQDASDDLRETAYRSLTQFKAPEVVPYLIDRLKDAPAATRPAILETLGQLTGQTLGMNHDAWARWWAKNGAGPAAR
jgi:HEAT repeat protein